MGFTVYVPWNLLNSGTQNEHVLRKSMGLVKRWISSDGWFCHSETFVSVCVWAGQFRWKGWHDAEFFLSRDPQIPVSSVFPFHCDPTWWMGVQYGSSPCADCIPSWRTHQSRRQCCQDKVFKCCCTRKTTATVEEERGWLKNDLIKAV